MIIKVRKAIFIFLTYINPRAAQVVSSSQLSPAAKSIQRNGDSDWRVITCRYATFGLT